MKEPKIDFARLDRRARLALHDATNAAARQGCDSITTVHLLAGVCSGGQGAIERVLCGLIEDRNTAAVLPLTPGKGIVFSPNAQTALEYALAEADAQQVECANAHLILGVLRVEGSTGAELLRELGIRVDGFRKGLLLGVSPDNMDREDRPVSGIESGFARQLTAEWVDMKQRLAQIERKVAALEG